MVAVERKQERNDLIRSTAAANPKWSMSDIASHLGLTRGVVVGVLDRARGSVATDRRKAPVQTREQALAPRPTPRPPAPAPKVVRPPPHDGMRPHQKLLAEGETRPVDPHPPGMLNIRLLALKERHCRAPLYPGDDKLMTFCGLEKVSKSSYCKHHTLRYGGGQ